MTEFQAYVQFVGGPAEAAKRLGRTPGSIYHILRGRRNITKELALEVERDSDGQFAASRILFGEQAT